MLLPKVHNTRSQEYVTRVPCFPNPNSPTRSYTTTVALALVCVPGLICSQFTQSNKPVKKKKTVTLAIQDISSKSKCDASQPQDVTSLKVSPLRHDPHSTSDGRCKLAQFIQCFGKHVSTLSTSTAPSMQMYAQRQTEFQNNVYTVYALSTKQLSQYTSAFQIQALSLYPPDG